jgi:hypothetical protein
VNCPACQRRLRFDTGAAAQTPAVYPLRVEGTIRHAPGETPWEYSVLVQVRDAQGAVVAKHVVSVGAIQPGDARTFTLQVEMRAPEETTAAAIAGRPPAADRGKSEPSSASSPQEIRKAPSPAPTPLPSRPK